MANVDLWLIQDGDPEKISPYGSYHLRTPKWQRQRRPNVAIAKGFPTNEKLWATAKSRKFCGRSCADTTIKFLSVETTLLLPVSGVHSHAGSSCLLRSQHFWAIPVHSPVVRENSKGGSVGRLLKSLALHHILFLSRHDGGPYRTKLRTRAQLLKNFAKYFSSREFLTSEEMAPADSATSVPAKKPNAGQQNIVEFNRQRRRAKDGGMHEGGARAT